MDAFSDVTVTRKLRSFRVPPEANPHYAQQRAERISRIFAAIAVFSLMMVGLLIAEPWDSLRRFFLRP